MQAALNTALSKNETKLHLLIGIVFIVTGEMHGSSNQTSWLHVQAYGLRCNNSNWKRTHGKHISFNTSNHTVACKVPLSLPNLYEFFETFTDATSKCQLGTVIDQGGKQIRFYTWRLKETQLKHTTMESREPSAVIKTLKSVAMSC